MFFLYINFIYFKNVNFKYQLRFNLCIDVCDASHSDSFTSFCGDKFAFTCY